MVLLNIFKYNLEQFLDLEEKKRSEHIEALNEFVIQKLLKINGIGLSTTTKILHTLYPKIIPMIDNPLQNVKKLIMYGRKINPMKYLLISIKIYK